jgi:uncharacterized protein involved in exopolysaccharide biosynthesis
VQPTAQATATDHLTFTELIAGIVARWRLILATAVACALAGLVASIVIPPVYRSNASFVANSSSNSRLQGVLGGMTGMDGILSQLGGSVGGDPSESPNFYLHLLSSRELLTRLLESRFPDPHTDTPGDSATLLSILRVRNSDPQRRMELGVKRMKKAIRPEMDTRTNLVWFSADARSSDMSAQIANRLIELVSSFDREIRASRAKSVRTFLQMRHDSAQTALRQAEENERYFYEKNRGFIGGSPALKFEEQRIKREVDLASDLYVNLDKQLEVARIDEINDAALITVVDSAVAPRKALWPRYWVTLFATLGLGALLGLAIAGSAAILADWSARNPDSWNYLAGSVARMRAELKAAFGLRRRTPPAATGFVLEADRHVGGPHIPTPNRADNPT